jgi:hypothetical protein
VLIDGRKNWKLHGRWFVASLIATVVAIALTVAASRETGRWPGGGSLVGLVYGVIAALIFLFEVAIVFKKTSLPVYTKRDPRGKKTRFTLRTTRWMLPAQTWMKAHIWLGLLTVPLVILHSGGRFGGMLTTVFSLVFAVVILSGIWGLLMQNVIPRMLLDAAAVETVYSQIDDVGEQYSAEARNLVLRSCGGDDESIEPAIASAAARGAGSHHIHGAARQVGAQIQRSTQPASELPEPIPSPTLQNALKRDIQPFLASGKSPQGLLGSRQRNAWYFEDLRLRVAPELRTLVDQLEELCERRRQLNVQRRLHFWLHNWMWLHLPLSIALIVLLVGHVITALRFG